MADSVRFPPSIGGSGRTYTSDANPDTGLFNGGHRRNLIPMLDDTVQAAGYVSKYAQAIDGAKDNAERAEDAKGFVEAVASAYRVNIMDAYRDSITLGANFKGGRYTLDNGERLDTNDPAQIWSVTREGPKWVEGPDGKYRQVNSHKLAREWRNGMPHAVSIEDSAMNLAYPTFGFGIGRTGHVESTIDVGPGKLFTYTEDTESNNRFYTLGIGLSGSKTITIIAKPKPGSQKRYLQIRGDSPAVGVSFDIEEGSVAALSSGVFARIRRRSDGTYLCRATLPANSSMLVLGLQDNTTVTGGRYTGDGHSGMLLGLLNLFDSSSPSSPIITTDAPAFRPADRVVRLIGAEINKKTFTIMGETILNDISSADWFGVFKVSGDSNTFGSGIGLQHKQGEIRALLGTSPNQEYFSTSIPIMAHGDPLRWAVSVDFVKGEALIAGNGVVSKILDVSNIEVETMFEQIHLSIFSLLGGVAAQSDKFKSTSEFNVLSISLKSNELTELTAV